MQVGSCQDFAKTFCIRFLFCSTAISQMCTHVMWHVCCMLHCPTTRILQSNLPPDFVTHALSHPPFKTRAKSPSCARERMKIALALFFANAANLIVCNDASLYRTRRDEDHNGRDGESSENDVGSGIDGSDVFSDEAFPSVSPLVPLRFSFLATDGGAEGGLRNSESSIPALELAIEHINANSSILPDYNLTYNLKRLQVKHNS